MQKHFLCIIMLTGILFLAGCSADPNKKANELFVEASQLMGIIKQNEEAAEVKSYLEIFESYENVQGIIERILTKYPSSDVAVELVSNQRKISDFTLSKFQELGTALKLLAEAEQKPLSCAFFVAKTINGKSSKTVTLLEIAVRYAKAGKKQEATYILYQALDTAKTIKEDALLLSNIAGLYAEVGKKQEAIQMLSQALDIAKTIEDKSTKAETLAEIAGMYAKTGQLSQALDIAKTIEMARFKTKALVKIAGKYSEVGKKQEAIQMLSQALDIAKTIKKPFGTWLSNEIVDMYARIGQLSQALNTVEGIEEKTFKAETLVKIAGKYSEAGKKQEATYILSQALDTAKTIKEDICFAKITGKCATRMLPRVLYLARTVEDKSSKAEILAEIAGMYARIGQLSQALNTAEGIEEKTFKAETLVKIAGKYLEAGKKQEASQILSQALDIAKIIKEGTYFKSRTLAEIAGMYAKTGQLSQAFDIAKTVEDKSTKAETLVKIAGKYSEAGKKQEASQILSQALDIAKTIEDKSTRVETLAEIAGMYAKTGQLSQSLDIARTIEDKSTRAETLAEIVGMYAKTGQLSQALDIAKTIEMARFKTKALVEIAGMYAKTGQQPSDKDCINLHEIVHATDPMRLIWE